MNLFGVGPLEAALVIIIAVVVLGPERFPEVAVQVAKAIKFLRGQADRTVGPLRQEFEQLTREYEEMRKELNDVRTTLTKQGSDITATMTQVMDEPKAALKATPTLQRLLDPSKPIVEPGGELPPDRQSGSNGTQA
jgi:sec-independent protein translocase protein TatB